MAKPYINTCGRFGISLSKEGSRDHDNGHGVSLSMPTGWNASCEPMAILVSVDDLHDLKYLIERAIINASKDTP